MEQVKQNDHRDCQAAIARRHALLLPPYLSWRGNVEGRPLFQLAAIGTASEAQASSSERERSGSVLCSFMEVEMSGGCKRPSRRAKWNFSAREFLGRVVWRKQTCRSEQFFSLSSSYC